MKNYLTNIRTISTLSVIWVLVSLVISFFAYDWTWFGRSGAILTLGGAALALRPLLRMGVEEFYRDQHIIDGGHFDPTPEEVEAERQGRLDVRASHIGFWFVVIGTIIWAYGDLIQRFVASGR
ncbi:MAG: hypothetical protein H0W77_04115 [Acidobacteria bacterium]|nr:hypothetical protein [Acidobacteriota bacterium]